MCFSPVILFFTTSRHTNDSSSSINFCSLRAPCIIHRSPNLAFEKIWILLKGLTQREPGQGGIQDAWGAESENVNIEQEMSMPLTAEGTEESRAAMPPTNVRSRVGRIQTKAVVNATKTSRLSLKKYLRGTFSRFFVWRLPESLACAPGISTFTHLHNVYVCTVVHLC